jgi:hypothetical protein
MVGAQAQLAVDAPMTLAIDPNAIYFFNPESGDSMGRSQALMQMS